MSINISGPAFIASSATNIYTPPNAAVYVVIKHIHVDNVTVAAATFSLYKGLTGGSAAGTEMFKDQSVAAKSPFDYYCAQKMLSTDFLSGIASAGSTLTIIVEYETVAV